VNVVRSLHASCRRQLHHNRSFAVRHRRLHSLSAVGYRGNAQSATEDKNFCDGKSCA